MPVLNLSVIPDDRKVGVLCETLGQVEMLIDAVRSQRSDVDVGDWCRELKKSKHANRVYFLNYCGSKSLQHGRPAEIKALGLRSISFDELWWNDLPEFEENQTGILSLLGL